MCILEDLLISRSLCTSCREFEADTQSCYQDDADQQPLALSIGTLALRTTHQWSLCDRVLCLPTAKKSISQLARRYVRTTSQAMLSVSREAPVRMCPTNRIFTYHTTTQNRDTNHALVQLIGYHGIPSLDVLFIVSGAHRNGALLPYSA